MKFEKRYLLFFSVDIIDSSQLKGKSDFRWATSITDFLNEFFRKFRKKISDSMVPRSQIKSTEIELWKPVGDEFLFYCAIEKNEDVLKCITSFCDTIKETNQIKDNVELGKHEHKEVLSLSCKGTVWGAFIPYHNIDLEIQDRIDFLGSSIDAGFRLAELATKHKLVIAPDVLWICCAAIVSEHDDTSAKFEKLFPPIFYEGEKRLKGVFGNKPLPVFWADTVQNNKNKHPNTWSGIKACKPKDLKEYLTEYLEEHPVLFCYNASDPDNFAIPK